ncbi:hypothetical protein PIB30_042829 [Stylosanthes scabra]|uniref:Uncharacterized protein n=1 Tax=Stylosanthes scabra TaxID=79078 RepID=A0ABU6VE34_9FABA|nr:hypothetical protein [Stylosanthes scabra]
MSWAWPGCEKDYFESWMHCKIRKCSSQSWGIAFFSIVWEIWSARNNIIFRGSGTSVDEARNHVLTRNKTWEQEVNMRKVLYKSKEVQAIHLHINPFSAIVLGYAVELVTEGTSSYLEYRDLVPHSKSFGQSLRDLTLTLARLWGTHT